MYLAQLIGEKVCLCKKYLLNNLKFTIFVSVTKKQPKKYMHKVGNITLFKLFVFAFNMGLKRSSTLPNKILKEECDEWIAVNIENRDPKERIIPTQILDKDFVKV